MKSRKHKSKDQGRLAAQLVQRLVKEARQAQKRSHAPYSGFKIGAAVLTANGDIFGGANVENSSYGATVCAERVAIWSAVTDSQRNSSMTSGLLDVVCVVSSSPEAWPPCGMCRQVISEFAHADTLVLTQGLKGPVKSYKFSELFPESFSAEFLKGQSHTERKNKR